MERQEIKSLGIKEKQTITPGLEDLLSTPKEQLDPSGQKLRDTIENAIKYTELTKLEFERREKKSDQAPLISDNENKALFFTSSVIVKTLKYFTQQGKQPLSKEHFKDILTFTLNKLHYVGYPIFPESKIILSREIKKGLIEGFIEKVIEEQRYKITPELEKFLDEEQQFDEEQRKHEQYNKDFEEDKKKQNRD